MPLFQVEQIDGTAAAFRQPSLRTIVSKAWASPRPSGADWIAIIAAVVTATLARAALQQALGDRTAFVTCLIAVLFVAWRHNFWSAVATEVFGFSTAVLLFVPPHGSLWIENVDDQVTIGLNILVGLVAALLIEALKAVSRENVRLFHRAREADRRKDEFLAMVSHELRNPLAAIRSATYVLCREDDSRRNLDGMVSLLDRQTAYLSRLVEDLLDVSRITRGTVDLKKDFVRLTELIESAVEIAKPLTTEKRQTLTVHLPSEPIGLFADSLRLVQVFANLLNNAAKFSPEGGRIWLSAERALNLVVVRVRDDGIGLESGSMGRIFELFERGEAPLEERREGLGIGLAIVKRLVELHAGTVEARSAGLGLGSEFIVHLPIVPLPEVGNEEQISAPRKPTVESPGTPRRILIVDDHVAGANSLAAVLRLFRHDVHVCFDGFAGLEEAATFHPEVVLAEIGLPRMSGLEFASQLRRVPGFVRTLLIAVTGYGSSANEAAARAAGFDHRIVKPIDPQTLEKLIDGHFAARGG